jgi:hypothetical protein
MCICDLPPPAWHECLLAKEEHGATVAMIERHYGQTNVLTGTEHETAKRKKAPRTDKATEDQNKPLRGKKVEELVPMGGALTSLQQIRILKMMKASRFNNDQT